MPDEDVVRVKLKDPVHRKILQSFSEHQYRFYLQATHHDIDGDGYEDIVLPVALGNPNIEFKVLRYNPRRDNLELLIEDSGLDFYRSHSAEIVVFKKTAQDEWSKRIYSKGRGHPVHTYTVTMKNKYEYGGENPHLECDYHRQANNAELNATGKPSGMESYCNLEPKTEMSEDYFEHLK